MQLEEIRSIIDRADSLYYRLGHRSQLSDHE